MSDDKKKSAIEDGKIVESLFQETMAKLKAFHKEKAELIKSFRFKSNLAELKKIQDLLKE